MIKVTFIGAGSVAFTRGLVKDILSVPEFKDSVHICFQDISKVNLEIIYQMCRKDMDANGVKSTLTKTTNRREAIKGSKYIFCTARVGGVEAFEHDIEIPMKYGVDQCVGDTLCAGGIMYAQRTSAFLRQCMDEAKELAAPGVWFMNYANPMAMNTWACTNYGNGINFVGLCHGVQGDHYEVAEALGVERKDLDCMAAGINHQTWFTKVLHKGVDVTAKVPEAFRVHPRFSKIEKVRVDVAQRFGYYSTESSGHYSEYVPWYRKRPDDMKNWVDLSSWIQGESAGYLRACKEGRNWAIEDFPNLAKQPALVYDPNRRGEEHGSYIMESLETSRVYRGFFNLPNHGCITNLPYDAVIETLGFVDRLGIHMAHIGDIPDGCAAVCNASINMQRLGAKAAVTGDINLLRQAMLMDPLVGAVCNPAEVWQMVDELLVAQAKWLPQYKAAIAGAKKRLAKGPLLKLRPYTGAIRIKEKTVAEMRKEADLQRKLAAASDKTRVEREHMEEQRKKKKAKK